MDKVENLASEVKKAKEVKSKKPEIPKYTLDQYAKKHKVNPGLVASLSYVLKQKGFVFNELKSEKEWKALFKKQAEKVYKY